MIACQICGKKALSGHNVSHSHRKTKRRFLPNLHSKRVEQGGRTERLKICAQCLKTLGKVRAEKVKEPV